MGLRYEAWTLPTAATFQRKIADIPVIEGTGTGTIAFSDSGDGALAVPADWDRLGELIASDEGSLIRVYDGSTLVHEWVAERVDHDVSDLGSVLISGPDVSGLLERAVVYPYDYDVNPTRFPDWVWGSDSNLLTNGGFEDGTNLIDNSGFEDGTVDPWWAGAVDGVSATLEIETTEVDTGTYSAKCTPLLTEGGMSTQVRGLYAGKTYTVSVRIKAGSGKTIQVGASGPQSIGQGTATRILFIEANPSNSQYEAQREVTASGAWQTISFNFVAGSNQTTSQISIRDASATPAVFYVDVVSVTGYGVGMDPWQPSNIDSVTTFEASTDVTADAGSYTGKVTATDGAGIYQTVDNAIEGAPYTATVKVRNTTGSARWALELRDQLGTRLAQSSVATSTSWQTLTVTATLPLDLPGDARQLQIWLVNYSGAAATVYVDSATLTEGLAAATVGDILTELLDDATSDHSADTRGTVLTWLDYSGFDATNDSGSTAWAASISFIAYRGETYLNVMRSLATLGYEWRIVAKATPSAGQTHNLEVYEPDGLGTDYSAASSPAIVYGSGTTSANIVKRIPNYTAVLVEGEDGVWSESKDATAVTNFGRWERYGQFIDSTGTSTLATHASELLSEESGNRIAARVRLSAGDWSRPMRDFTVGDTLQWQVPPLMTKNARKVQRITYTNTTPETYDVTGSRVYTGEAGLAYAVDRLLQKFDPLRKKERARSSSPVTVAGGGGGMATVLVAASNASALSKAKADYVCTGVNDQDVIQTAIDYVFDQGYNGVVWLSEGEFTITVPSGATAIDLKNGIELRGMGSYDLTTYLVASNNSDPGAAASVVQMKNGSTVSNLTIYNSGYSEPAIRLASGNGTMRIVDVWVESSATCIYASNNDRVWVQRCYLYTYDAQTSDDCPIYATGDCDRWWVDSCETVNGYHSLFIDNSVSGNSGLWVVANNYFWAALKSGIRGAHPLSSASFIQVIGNLVASAGADSTTGDDLSGIEFEGSGSSRLDAGRPDGDASLVIADNIIEAPSNGHGISLKALFGASVHHNHVEDVQKHGIRLEGASDCLVDGNIIYWPNGTSDTYDGVHVADGSAVGSNGNYIIKNRVTDATDATPVYFRYGINVAGTACADNIIVGNDLRAASGATGTAIANSGSGTLLSWPAHGTYGDNFT